MSKNVEIKAKVENFERLLKTASEIAKKSSILNQTDTFFHSPNGRLKLREFGGKSQPSELIYYDRPDTEGPKISEFVRVIITDAENLKEALKKSNGIRGVLIKERHLYLHGQTRIHIDKVQGLGTFMELEVCLNEEQSLEKGQDIAYELMQKLGIERSALIAGAYMDVMEKKNDIC